MNPQICGRQRSSGDHWIISQEEEGEGSKKLTQLFLDFLSIMLDSHLNFEKVIFEIHFVSKIFKTKTTCHVFFFENFQSPPFRLVYCNFNIYLHQKSFTIEDRMVSRKIEKNKKHVSLYKELWKDKMYLKNDFFKI